MVRRESRTDKRKKNQSFSSLFFVLFWGFADAVEELEHGEGARITLSLKPITPPASFGPERPAAWGQWMISPGFWLHPAVLASHAGPACGFLQAWQGSLALAYTRWCSASGTALQPVRQPKGADL